MNKWKTAFWICLTVLILMSFGSIHTIIDQGITLTYLKEGYTNIDNDLDQIIELINKTDFTKDEVILILQKYERSKHLDLTSDTIELERVNLIFDNNNIKVISKRW